MAYTQRLTGRLFEAAGEMFEKIISGPTTQEIFESALHRNVLFDAALDEEILHRPLRDVEKLIRFDPKVPVPKGQQEAILRRGEELMADYPDVARNIGTIRVYGSSERFPLNKEGKRPLGQALLSKYNFDYPDPKNNIMLNAERIRQSPRNVGYSPVARLRSPEERAAGVLTHEFGHQVQAQINRASIADPDDLRRFPAHIENLLQNTLHEAGIQGNIRQVLPEMMMSKYATTNDTELFAELFTADRLGDLPDPQFRRATMSSAKMSRMRNQLRAMGEEV